MSAREELFGFVEVGGDEEDLPTFAAALDAYRDEVLREAAEKIRVELADVVKPNFGGIGWSLTQSFTAAHAANLIDPDKP